VRKNISFILLLLIVSCNKSEIKHNRSVFTDSVAYYLSKVEFQQNRIIKGADNKKAFLHLIERENDSIARDQLFKITKNFYELQDEKKIFSAANLLIEKSQAAKDSLNLAKALNIIGNQYINKGKNDSAYFFLIKAEKLFLRLDDSLSIGKNFIDKAFIQLYENDFSGCEVSCIQGLNYLKNVDNVKQSEYDAHNLIGISSNELKNFDNALIYHNKALKIAVDNKLNSKFHLASNSLNNIGVVYQNQGKHREAISMFKTAKADNNLLLDYPSLYAIITDNLAYSKFKVGDLSDLPELFFEALTIRENNSLTSGIIANKIHLSEFYAARKDSVNARKFAQEALALAKKNKVSGDLLGTLKQLSVVELDNASKYTSEYIKISDSIQQAERRAKDKFARIAFETEEIANAKDKLEEQNRILFYFFASILSIGVLLFVIRSQRSKNRELMLKQAQQKANEDIYNLMISQQKKIDEGRIKEKKRIAQELHDGILGRLFGARLNLDSLNRKTDASAAELRSEYLSELKNIEQDIREISHDLNREKYVLINNFLAIVHDLIENQRSILLVPIEFNIDTAIEWEIVPNNAKINLYRIIQETLQNIRKYSRATRVEISLLISNEGQLVLKVKDDGVGFSTKQKIKGIGIANIVARSEELGGACEVKSRPGSGVTITVRIPYDPTLTFTAAKL
jgi:signal transduction histidine kinase